MSDSEQNAIIKRLRAAAADFNADGELWPGDLLASAAEEIERLIAVIEAGNARLREDLAFADARAEKAEALANALIEWRDAPLTPAAAVDML